MALGLAILFWVFLGLAVHPYVTYPIIVLFWSILHPQQTIRKHIQPAASLIIAAFNEEETIGGRIENALEMNYPHDRLEVIIASDGSTDRTNEIVAEYARRDPRVRLLPLERDGKSAAINAAVHQAKGEIIVLSDAATRFGSDTLNQMASYFADPQVHCAVGKVTLVPRDNTAYTFSESLYWRYESRLREIEGKIGLAFIGSGPCMAVRRQSYPLLREDAMDDLTATLLLIADNKRILYVSDLTAYDYMDGGTNSQIRSRERRESLSLASIWHNRALLNPFRYPRYAFSIFSHKIFRWLLGVWLLGMLAISVVLGIGYDIPLYRYILYGQVAFYGLASVGLLVAKTTLGRIPVLSVPMTICVVSLAFLKGVFGFLHGAQAARWEPATSYHADD